MDEKSQSQALNRIQPILPLRPGLPEPATPRLQAERHHHPAAALEVATGKVTDRSYERHGKGESFDFLSQVAKASSRRQLHVALDNYHAHEHDDIN